jgi:hypothetical protein
MKAGLCTHQSAQRTNDCAPQFEFKAEAFVELVQIWRPALPSMISSPLNKLPVPILSGAGCQRGFVRV